jgi:hypothetical protein
MTVCLVSELPEENVFLYEFTASRGGRSGFVMQQKRTYRNVRLLKHGRIHLIVWRRRLNGASYIGRDTIPGLRICTIFTLNSIDKFLKESAYCGMVLPDTLLNGYHHEPFRKQEYLHSVSNVAREEGGL